MLYYKIKEKDWKLEKITEIEITNTPEYKLLDTMIDELGEAGVDTSYFPKEAQKILQNYATKIKINI